MDRIPKALKPSALCKVCKPGQFAFTTTAELTGTHEIIGQDRAVDAIQFGLDLDLKGFNIYVMGPPGVSKHTAVKKLVIPKSRLRSDAADWCYVYNFENALKPKVLKLPPGLGNRFQKDMDNLIEKFHLDFSETTAFDSIQQLKKNYVELPQIGDHLDGVLENIKKNLEDFITKPKDHLTVFDQPHIEFPPYSRLKVNVLVDNSHTIGRPVVYEDNPIYHNLIGRVENMQINGSLVSDFTLIRSGSLHRANNGYLILNAGEVLNHHLAWEGVKRAIHNAKIKIEPLEQSIEFWSAQTLDPEPIPLNVKIILIGDRDTYHMMCDEEPDFKELFKVVSDFENDFPRNKKNMLGYANLIGSIAKDDDLKPLHRSAVASLIDYSSRLIEDTEKLSTHVHSIKSVIQQADYWADNAKRKVIQQQDVKKAIQQERHRLNRVQERVYEDIKRSIINIQTSGEKVGQVNALTIIEEGEYEFGQPSRITVTTHVGDGNIIDIQKEIELSGSIHSKGILILSGFLKGRYASVDKISLSASIVFEQMYTAIDGDSASAAELCALLSAIGNIPLKQSIAITGSVDQFGNLLPVSSINEKIEGFFAVCKQRKLTGKQGVIIPALNAKNLMLDEEVIEASRKGLFHVYALDHIDKAITLLTSIRAGKRNANGGFTKDSVNELVNQALKKE